MALDRSPELCNVIPNAKHIKTIILTKIQNPISKVLTRFSFIWHSDLFFFLPLFEHGLDITKTNILTKLLSKNAATGVLAIFSLKLA